MDINNLVPPGIWAGCIIAIRQYFSLHLEQSGRDRGEDVAMKGSINSGFIALNGEAGFQPEILRGGIHLFFPFTYRIHTSDLVTVGQGKIAYVFDATARRSGLRRCSQPTTPRTNPTFRMRASFSSAAARKVRNARSCAREPMRSTPRNLRSSPTSGCMAMP
jgi:hypothetical protein